jgi:serine phosphatase RsbU (regulator of sigma subunit)
LYTDGITEARGADGREFGMGAVIDRFRTAGPAGPEEVVEEILTGVRDHTRAALIDDATILVIELRDAPG